jgi:hypothetical protein
MLTSPARLCRPCRLAGPAHAAATAGLAIQEGEIRRETDCLLEGDGFELSVPRQIGKGFEVSSETSLAPVRRGGFIRAFASSRRLPRGIRRAAAHRRMRRRHQGRVVSTSNPISCSSACKSSFTRSAKRPFSTKSGTVRANCAAWFVSPPKLIVISPARLLIVTRSSGSAQPPYPGQDGISVILDNLRLFPNQRLDGGP